MESNTQAAPQLPISDVQDTPTHSGPSLAERFSQFKTEVAQQAQTSETTAKAEAATDTTQQQQADTSTGGDTTQQQQELEPADATQPNRKRRAWGELTKKADEFDKLTSEVLPAKERELTELKAKVEQMSAVDADKFRAEIATREKQITDYENRLAVYDIRESKKFKEGVIAPLQDIATKTATLAKMYKVNPVDLQQAFQIEDPADQLARINELTAEFDPMHKAKVWDLSEKSQELLAKAWEMQQNAAEAKKELEFIAGEERKRSEQEQGQRLNASVEAVKKQFLERVPMLKDRPELAEKVFAARPSDDPAMSVYNAMSGIITAEILKDNYAKDAEIKRLTGELEKRSALGVKAGGASPQQSQAASANETTPTAQTANGSAWARAKSWASTQNV